MFRLSPVSLLALNSSFALWPVSSPTGCSPWLTYSQILMHWEEVQDVELILALLLTPMCPGAGPCLFWEVSFSICKWRECSRHLSLAMLLPTVCDDVIGLSLATYLLESFRDTFFWPCRFPVFVLLRSYLHIKTDFIFSSILAPLTVPVRQARLLLPRAAHTWPSVHTSRPGMLIRSSE